MMREVTWKCVCVCVSVCLCVYFCVLQGVTGELFATGRIPEYLSSDQLLVFETRLTQR